VTAPSPPRRDVYATPITLLLVGYRVALRFKTALDPAVVDNENKRDRLICRFRITLQGDWQVALYLANTLRDDLNSDIA